MDYFSYKFLIYLIRWIISGIVMFIHLWFLIKINCCKNKYQEYIKVTIDRLEFILDNLNKDIKPIFKSNNLTIIIGSIKYKVKFNRMNSNVIVDKYFDLMRKKYEK